MKYPVRSFLHHIFGLVNPYVRQFPNRYLFSLAAMFLHVTQWASCSSPPSKWPDRLFIGQRRPTQLLIWSPSFQAVGNIYCTWEIRLNCRLHRCPCHSYSSSASSGWPDTIRDSISLHKCSSCRTSSWESLQCGRPHYCLPGKKTTLLQMDKYI